MKILKMGKISDAVWKTKVVCTGAGNGGLGCKSLLEVCEKDIYHTHHYDYGGGHDVYHTTQCPVCRKETDIENIPYNLGPFLDKKEWIEQQKELP